MNDRARFYKKPHEHSSVLMDLLDLVGKIINSL
jgi:hypothetical protein